jgi:queuosine precursor transporter
MNLAIFFFHLTVVLSLLVLAVRWGKTALILFFTLCFYLANFFVTMQIDLFGLTVTCSDAYTVGCFFSMGLMQHLYGKSYAKKSLYLAFSFLFAFLLLSQVQLFYKPSIHDQVFPLFRLLLQQSPRIIFASFFAFFVSQRCNLFLLALLKKIQTFSLSGALTIATLFSQLIDTLLFSFIGLYHHAAHLSHIIWVSFAIKAFLTLISFPMTYLLRKWGLKEEEYA